MGFRIKRVGPLWRWELEDGEARGWALTKEGAKRAATRALRSKPEERDAYWG